VETAAGCEGIDMRSLDAKGSNFDNEQSRLAYESEYATAEPETVVSVQIMEQQNGNYSQDFAIAADDTQLTTKYLQPNCAEDDFVGHNPTIDAFYPTEGKDFTARFESHPVQQKETNEDPVQNELNVITEQSIYDQAATHSERQVNQPASVVNECASTQTETDIHKFPIMKIHENLDLETAEMVEKYVTEFRSNVLDTLAKAEDPNHADVQKNILALLESSKKEIQKNLNLFEVGADPNVPENPSVLFRKNLQQLTSNLANLKSTYELLKNSVLDLNLQVALVGQSFKSLCDNFESNFQKWRQLESDVGEVDENCNSLKRKKDGDDVAFLKSQQGDDEAKKAKL